jgi:hypothetical protein
VWRFVLSTHLNPWAARLMNRRLTCTVNRSSLLVCTTNSAAYVGMADTDDGRHNHFATEYDAHVGGP